MTVDVLDTDQAGQRIVRGGMLRTGSYAIGILVGLISTPLLTRHLGPDGFGHYNTVTALTFVIVGLTEGGLLAIGVREMSIKDADGRREFMRIYLGIRILLATVGAAGMVAFAFAAGYPHTVLVGAIIAAAGLYPLTAYDVCAVPLQVGLRLGITAVLELARQVITTVAIIVLVVVGASLYPFFALPGLVGGLGALGAYAATRREVPLRPRFDAAEWRALLRDALPFTVATAVAVIYFRVAVILMSLLSNEQQTGYFSLAFRVVEIGSGVPWLIVSSALPLLTRTAATDQDRMRYALQRLFEACAILGAAAALLFAVGAPVAVDIIGGDDFDASVDPLRILGVALIGTFLIALWGQSLLSLREHKALLLANASALVVALVLTIALAPSHGALGGAIATATTELWLAAVYGFVLFRRYPHLRPRSRVLLPITVGVVLAGAPALVLPSLAATLVAGTVFITVLLVTRAVPAEVFQALTRRGDD